MGWKDVMFGGKQKQDGGGVMILIHSKIKAKRIDLGTTMAEVCAVGQRMSKMGTCTLWCYTCPHPLKQ